MNRLERITSVDIVDRLRRRNIATDRLTENADFGKKKSSFPMKLILILAGI